MGDLKSQLYILSVFKKIISQKISLTFESVFTYNENKLLAGEGSSLAPLPFPFSNLGASPASASLAFL
jgi:hypothetical protein